MVMIIPIIGILLLLNTASFGSFTNEIFWIAIILIMFFPVGVAANVMLYKGRL